MLSMVNACRGVSDMADIEIEIDGKTLTATPDQTIIQVADAAGIYIPRFCYHKHLSVAANCRMCLVECDKSPKAVPACATPVMPGMKVFTKSQKTIEAQRAVMEFLLINHPLDCPICDQGGECELQDLSMGYGSSHSDYDECKRAVPDKNIGPLIATEMTRCILCTRCVRFQSEVAGMRELGLAWRGEHERITTYVEHAIESEVSGNIIDLCPVGALTSKPYRFTARAWELQQAPSIGAHDCVGSNINVHTRYGKVMRVVARENNDINTTWISDRDRFSYTGLYHADRLHEPMAKIDGKWQVVEWQHALELAAAGIHDVIAEAGADKLGALASPNATLEEFYLLQKIMRELGSPHIDHRLRAVDASDQETAPLFPGLAMLMNEIEQCDAILLIGSNIQKEQPMLGLRVRKASLKGASVLAVNPVDYKFNFNVAAKQIAAPHHMPNTMADLVKALAGEKVDAATQAMADHLRDKKKVCVILGALAIHHPQAAVIRTLAGMIAGKTGTTLSVLTGGANAAGAWIAGAVPHRHAGGETINHPGLNAYEMLAKPRKGYILLNVEPEFDCANAKLAKDAIQQAKFTVALSMYRNAVLEEHADVILPIAPFTETSGTFVNVTGEWQSFTGVANAEGQSRPAWKVLRVLGNFLHLQGFDYESSEDIKHEIRAIFDKAAASFSRQKQELSMPTLSSTAKLSRIGEVPLYAVDSLVRRAAPLQEAQAIMEGDVAEMRIHPDTARKFAVTDGAVVNVKQHSASASLTVKFDERIAQDAVWIAGGIAATANLGDLFGEVELC